MREQTVAMYCFLDDLLTRTRSVWARPTDPRRRLSDAEVLTTALVAARYFGGNLVLGRHYMEQHWGMKSLDNIGFTRHAVCLCVEQQPVVPHQEKQQKVRGNTLTENEATCFR